jgi:NADPH:quinone reductase-like Zn-dependent oxidoreductase
MRAVRFDHYGGIDVLQVVDVPRPVPARGEVLVRVKAAGTNPGEASIRQGVFAQRWPATFPSGQGSDFAGVVEESGEGVSTFRAGDEVIGFTNARGSQAELLVVPGEQLTRRSPQVPWEQAGALFVAGTTAVSAVRAVGLKSGETVVVSGAAGGVGTIVVQLARNMGAKVLGLASPTHHAWLAAHGAIPVSYDRDVVARIRAAAGGNIDAFIDTHGHGYVDVALQLGLPPARINTIIDFAAAAKHGVGTEGSAASASAAVLADLAAQIAAGKLEIPIARTYPLTEVRAAYAELEQRHTLGKIVLLP